MQEKFLEGVVMIHRSRHLRRRLIPSAAVRSSIVGIVGILYVLFLECAWAQSTPNDTIMLLHDRLVQRQASEAIDSMYNFKFEAAQLQFHWIRQIHPSHPLSYFLLTLSEWWKIMPNIKETRYDKFFIRYADKTILVAQQLRKRGGETEGAFFLSGVYALLGRFHGEKGNWLRAVWAAKQALQYQHIVKQRGYLSAEILIGDALYNYYAEWIFENYPKLKIFKALLPKGNKALGIEQLNYVSNHSFYARIEAQHFLMRILNEDNIDKENALRLAQYLHTNYPDNPCFHRYYVRLLYEDGEYSTCREASQTMLNHIAQQKTGYGANSGRYAAFFLGWIYQKIDRNPALAKVYYQKTIEFAEQINHMEYGYTIHALYELGVLSQKEKNFKEAAEYFSKVKIFSSKKKEIWKNAKENHKKVQRQLRKAS